MAVEAAEATEAGQAGHEPNQGVSLIVPACLPDHPEARAGAEASSAAWLPEAPTPTRDRRP